MKKMMLLLLSMFIFVVGCDSDNSKNDDSDKDPVKVEGVFEADNSCKDEGKKVYISYPAKDICINSDQIGVSGDDNVYGFTVPNGEGFINVRRDGDYSDGDLKSVGTFDVSKYPYHASFTIAPKADSDCEDSSDCTTVYALKGRWSVASIDPFKGDLMATSIVSDDQENCWDDQTGDLSNCSDVKNDTIKMRWNLEENNTAECKDEGKKVFLSYPEKEICVNSDEINLLSSDDDIYGFTVSYKTGLVYLLRDGDISDANLKSVGNFDVAKYPYHLSMMIAPEVNSDCYDSSDCDRMYALSGSWNITSIDPFAGSVSASSIVDEDQENCWDDQTGDLSNCSGVRNETITFRWNL